MALRIELCVAGGSGPPRGGQLVVTAERWRSESFDLQAFDDDLDALARGPSGVLCVEAPRAALAAVGLEVATRAQRLGDRRNAWSSCPLFDRVLAAHRALHDLEKPLVRADHRHALDTWQWALRLEASASLALQLAALFHDVERLVTEADRRVEHHATDYAAFKDAHAREGARMAGGILEAAGVGLALRERVGSLVARHERPGSDPELALLNDADALSFFSLNSPGFADHYGEEHTRRKVAFTLARMRPGARARLSGVRLRSDVAAMLGGELAFLQGGSAPEEQA